MRTINQDFATFGSSVLLLGMKGDSNATQIKIDCAAALAEYSGTTAALSIKAPDGTVYPGDISVANGIMTWNVAARDCSQYGHGSARIDLVNGNGIVVASEEAATIILKTHMTGIAPSQISDWTDAASVALQEVRAALLDIIDTNDDIEAAEAARVLAETGRVSAEQLRTSAETARATAETSRATAETSRATAETARATAETARASAETARASAETSRASAEQQRVSEFTTMQANAQGALSYVAPSEDSSTASMPHAVGSDFIYNGKLMKATSAIAQGATIVPYASGVTNYNCAEVPNGLSGEVYNATNTANAAANNAADAQQLVAPVESMAGMPTSVATMTHATGSYFVFGGVLYQATADIAVGDTIATTGTGANAAEVPGGVSGQVADLKSAFDSINAEYASGSLYENGGIYSNGSMYNSTERLRNKDYIDSSLLSSYKCNTGYETYVAAYNAETSSFIGLWNGSVFTTSGGVLVTEFDFTKYSYKYKLVIKKSAGGSITPDDGVNVVYKTFTDKTLTEENKAADAKVVGEEISGIMSAISDSQGSIIPSAELESAISTLNDECGIYVPPTSSGTTEASSAVQKVLDNVSIANGKKYNLTFTIRQASTNDIYIGFYEQGSTEYKFIMTLASGATQKSQNFTSGYDITNGFIGVITYGPAVDYTVTFADVNLSNAGSRIDSIEKAVSSAGEKADDVTKLWQSENLFSGIYETDKAISGTGELTTLDGYSATEFLRVQPGNTIYFSYQQAENYRNKADIQSYGIYDADYKLILASVSYWNYKLSIPDTAQFIRIAYNSNYNSTALALNYNAINQAYGEYEAPYYTLPDKITGNYTITNLVSPTNSLDEWSATSGTLASNYSGGEIFATGNGGGSDLIINNSKAIPFVSGHRYYFRIKCRINKACNYIALRPLHSVAGIAQVFSPTVDFKYTWGMFVEPDHASGTCDVAFQIYAHFDSVSAESEAKLTIKEVMIIDTTDLPDLALFQFDRIPYIYGTEHMRLDEEAQPLPTLDLSVRQTRSRTAVVTFVADDGLENDYLKMRPLSEKYSAPMVMAVPPMIGYRIEERHALFAQNILGWEMASHSYNHVNLTTLTEPAIINQLELSKSWMEKHGLYCSSFVYPEGGNNENIRRLTKQYYQLACTTSPGVNTGVIPSFSIKRRPLGSFYVSGTYEEYKSYVDEAVSDNAWLVFMLHPSNAQHDATQQEYFEQIIQYVQSLNIPILTLRDAYMQYFGNVVEAGDYTGGADGVAIAGNGAKANI